MGPTSKITGQQCQARICTLLKLVYVSSSKNKVNHLDSYAIIIVCSKYWNILFWSWSWVNVAVLEFAKYLGTIKSTNFGWCDIIWLFQNSESLAVDCL